MAADGSVVIDTLIDTKGFGRGMTNMKSQFSSLSKVVRRVGVTIGAAFSIKKALDLGSDLQEVQNVVDVTFTTMSEKVNEFAKAAATTAGLSETMAKKYVGTYGAMSKSFGFAEKDALEMSTTLTQLTGDVASFYNLTQDEAYTKLKSVFTGETESLKDLGVVMTQTALDSFAMAKGYGKTTSAMTEQEKVALRYQFVMEQLSGAQGDFLRTSDGWANQVRVLKLNVESFMATVGQGLINLLTPVLKAVNRVMSTLQSVGNQFLKWTETITGKKNSVSSGMSSTANSAEQVAGSMEETAAASKKVQNNLSGLDEISIWSSGEDASSDALNSVVSALGSVSTEDIFKSDEITDTIEDAVLDISPAKVGEWLSDALVYAFNGIGKLVDIIDWGDVGRGFVKFIRGINWEELFTSFLRLSGSAIKGIGIALGEGIKEAWEGGKVKDWLIGLQADPLTGELEPWDPFNYLMNLANEAGMAADTVLEKIVFGISSGILDMPEEEVKSVFGVGWDALWSGKLGPLDAITALFGSDALAERMREGMAELADEERKALISAQQEVLKAAIESGNFEAAFEYLDFLRESGFIEYAGGTMDDILARIGLSESFKAAADEYSGNLVEWIQKNGPKLTSKLNSVINNQHTLLQNALDSGNTELATIIQGQIVIFQERMEQLVSIIEGDTVSVDVNKFALHYEDIYWAAKKSATEEGDKTASSYLSSILSFITSNSPALAQIVQSEIGGAFSSGATSSVDAWMNAISALLPPAMQKILEKAKEIVNQDIKAINDWIDDVTSENGDKRVPPPDKLGYAGAVKAGVLKLPYLAKGTVIPPNAPFAAILGDQKRGTNIEAPLDTIKQALREVMGEGGSGGGNSYNITAMAKGKTIFELVLSEGKMKQAQTGKNPFLLT